MLWRCGCCSKKCCIRFSCRPQISRGKKTVILSHLFANILHSPDLFVLVPTSSPYSFLFLLSCFRFLEYPMGHWWLLSQFCRKIWLIPSLVSASRLWFLTPKQRVESIRKEWIMWFRIFLHVLLKRKIKLTRIKIKNLALDVMIIVLTIVVLISNR